MKYSVIISSYKESRTIKKAILSFFEQENFNGFEIIVVAPDDETLNAAREAKQTHPDVVKTIKDKGKGKPSALNLAIKETTGEILIYTDGDVRVGEDTIQHLIKPFENPRVGAVSGHPMPINSRKTKFGFWSHLLTQAGAHKIRMIKNKTGDVECSGYLMAIRKKLMDPLPQDVLCDDPVMSHLALDKGYSTKYAPRAFVFVKFPDNYKDWLNQKIRACTGYTQTYLKKKKRMRSFFHEAIRVGWAISYPKNLREFWWMLELLPVRIYIWLAAYSNKLKRKSFKQVWKRVPSTK